MMNYLVLKSCYMQRIKLINPVTGETIPGSERGFGFFARETDYGLESDYADCSHYLPEEIDVVFDSWMNAGKFFAFVSMIIGGLGFLILFSTCFCAYTQNMFERWLMWSFILASCASGLMFLVFGSEHCQENKCKVAAGSGYAISTWMFWVSTANTVKSMTGAPPKKDKPKKKRRNRRGNSDDGDEEDDEFDDLYYEEGHKYPLPESTPEGRRRYAAVEEYANDTEREYAKRFEGEEDPDSSVEDEDEYSYGEEEEFSGSEEEEGYEYSRSGERLSPRKRDKHGSEATTPQSNGPQPDFLDHELSEAPTDGAQEESPHEDVFSQEYGQVSAQNSDDGYNDTGYDRTPRVGDVDGPTIA